MIVYQFAFHDRVIFGVRALGQPMAGLTHAEAQKFLVEKLGEPNAILARYGGERLVVRDGARTWRAYPWELGLRTDFAPVAGSALLLGHRGSFVENWVEQTRCLVLGCDLSGEAQFDEQTALAYLDWLSTQVELPARDASVHIDGIRVVATPAQKGRELDLEVMVERMRARVIGSERGDLTLAFREVEPLIADASEAKTQVEALIAAPMLLTYGGRAWAVDQAALAGMIRIQPTQGADEKLRLTVSLDRAQLAAFLKPIARELAQPPRDARFTFDPTTGALTPIVTSQLGQTLNVDDAAKQLEQQMLNGATRVPGSAAPREAASARSVVLPVNVTKPTIAMEDAAKFGIKELVAQGVSNFKGSSAGRIQNVRTATEQFQGIVVPPGAIFSFDYYLGDVVEANGYDDAYIIFADRTVLGPGGGVCQVSSTMFRAAFFAGLPIVERWAHAYRVGYYEPPVGLDATVFAPTVDLKFKNDTDAYLLIQPKLDLRNTTLTFNLYGTKPNRTVEMEDPIQERIIPHGAAIYTDDPTLKKGTTKQVDFAHDGMDVTIWRKISVNGQIVKRDKFFSRYEPWVARYQVGTKVVK
ncbi:MAG: VanW family protein [Chloroflexi bacterium]|nr:VanW family protein [Chloroflexota bacterium]